MRGMVARSAARMPKTSTPVLRPWAVAMTCPLTRGAARVTPGTARKAGGKGVIILDRAQVWPVSFSHGVE